MAGEGSSYNDSNRAFLQAFLARSSLTFDEARPILAAIFTTHGRFSIIYGVIGGIANGGKEKRRMLATDVTEVEFNNYIAMANKAISPFDLEIRNTEHQISGKRTYSLINSTDSPTTQLATSYSADEISYLKRVLDFMFETNNTPRKEIMAITSMEAVRLAKAPTDSSRETQTGPVTQGSSGQSLTMVQAQKMLDNLVVEGWLEKSMKGFYSLSPRALMELRGWLVDTYNDVEEEEEGEGGVLKIKSCFSCKGIITVVSILFACDFLPAHSIQGQRCPRGTCGCRLHEICVDKFFRFQKSTKCPVCKTADWKDNKSFVGELVLTSTDEYLQGRRRSVVNGIGSHVQREPARGNQEQG